MQLPGGRQTGNPAFARGVRRRVPVSAASVGLQRLIPARNHRIPPPPPIGHSGDCLPASSAPRDGTVAFGNPLVAVADETPPAWSPPVRRFCESKASSSGRCSSVRLARGLAERGEPPAVARPPGDVGRRTLPSFCTRAH